MDEDEETQKSLEEFYELVKGHARKIRDANITAVREVLEFHRKVCTSKAEDCESTFMQAYFIKLGMELENLDESRPPSATRPMDN